MAISFLHLPLDGLHGGMLYGPPELQTVRTKFPGVIGISEIALESGMRAVWCDSWLFNDYTAAQIVQTRRQLDVGVGLHGTLTVTGNIPETFDECTFEGFLPDEAYNHQPIADVAGLLGTAGRFFMVGRLLWTQHRVSLNG